METAIALIILLLTILPFWKYHEDYSPILFGVAIIAWLFGSFYFGNLAYPLENAYLSYAAMVLGLSMTLVMAIFTYLASKGVERRRADSMPKTVTNAERKARRLAIIKQRATKQGRPWYGL